VAGRSLYLSHDAECDWLTAVEFGRVDDGQPAENWRPISETFAFLLERSGGPEIGFRFNQFSLLDVAQPDGSEIWAGPRFDVPVLAMRGASAGEIAATSRSFFAGQSSLNRQLFSAAVNAGDEEALRMWRGCIQAGDAMAHYGLGYTLFTLGRFDEAERHLRYYAAIAPADSWTWCWIGKTAQAVGDLTGARAAYVRALELEAAGSAETDARDLVEHLDTPGRRTAGRPDIAVGDKIQAYIPDESRWDQPVGVVTALGGDSVTFVAEGEYDMFSAGSDDYYWAYDEPKTYTVPVSAVTFHWPEDGRDVLDGAAGLEQAVPPATGHLAFASVATREAVRDLGGEDFIGVLASQVDGDEERAVTWFDDHSGDAGAEAEEIYEWQLVDVLAFANTLAYVELDLVLTVFSSDDDEEVSSSHVAVAAFARVLLGPPLATGSLELDHPDLLSYIATDAERGYALNDGEATHDQVAAYLASTGPRQAPGP